MLPRLYFSTHSSESQHPASSSASGEPRKESAAAKQDPTAPERLRTVEARYQDYLNRSQSASPAQGGLPLPDDPNPEAEERLRRNLRRIGSCG